MWLKERLHLNMSTLLEQNLKMVPSVIKATSPTFQGVKKGTELVGQVVDKITPKTTEEKFAPRVDEKERAEELGIEEPSVVLQSIEEAMQKQNYLVLI